MGSVVLGKGFIVSLKDAEVLISKDPRNKEVLFPYLNGEDLNNNPEQKASRWIINFFDWSEEKASTYQDCFEIVKRLVKPERQRPNNNMGRNKWWQFYRRGVELYETISQLDQVMVINRYSKHLTPDFQPINIVFSDSIVVIALSSYSQFTILSSVIHDAWAWKNSSTMGASTLRYSASKAFESFPFPKTESNNLEEIGNSLINFRKSLMVKANMGLTELYNLFHNPKLETTHELYSDILQLRKLHFDINKFILKAYNWDDIQLKHDFYDIEYLPENDRVRLSIHPDARREILKRLLILNQERHITEAPAKTTTGNNRLQKLSDSLNLFTNPIDG
ncbi:type IIL restriction-modification enzyme MmeI [Taibaiella koreensis]|uniref:type IIL restriction-modification enzyme MmeI n=1 Tax=Taibaiella koreensis TaxID=1268548 RepID=UPI001968CC36|nr:type IIL restriction-modification enzyme MmeI [Taibaiella koreensis]